MQTKYLKVYDRAGYAEAVKAAAAVLDSGGIVGIPTETVYGLAASAEHPEAIARLKELKGRDGGKKFTICIALKSDAARFAAAVPRAAEKLMNRFWPGPLTLVLPAKSGGMVGLRAPGLALTRDILLKTDATIVIPSANPAGLEPATTASAVLDYFDGKIELIVDAGPSQLQTASTVVEVAAEGQVRILRNGSVSPEDIRSAVVRTILFLCTGNLCRSPMAAGIARQYLADRLGISPDDIEAAGFRVLSAGVAAAAGAPASPEAVEAMKEINIDISRHRSRPLTLELVRDADIIFVMSPYHLSVVKELDASAGARAQMLDGGAEIADPIGSPVSAYRKVREQIRSAILKRLEEI